MGILPRRENDAGTEKYFSIGKGRVKGERAWIAKQIAFLLPYPHDETLNDSITSKKSPLILLIFSAISRGFFAGRSAGT